MQRNVSQRWLAYESSEIDWCEDNYRVNPYVAEFVNTISNILLVIFPVFLIRSNIWRSYLQHVSVGPQISLYMISVAGLGSVYFHGTLSLMGQFLDEIAQLWGFTIVYAFFFPARFLPKIIPRAIFILIGAALTLMWFIDPNIYRFWSFSICIPTWIVISREYSNGKNSHVLWYFVFGFRLFCICTIFWLVDILFCDDVKSLGFPGSHFFFHICVAWISYIAFTLFAFFRADGDAPHIKATLKTAFLVIPYVHCEKE